jgi:hypothetical protein
MLKSPQKAWVLALSLSLVSGCASKVQLDYEPANEVPGSGPVGLRGFVYAPAEAGQVNPDQSQVVGAPLKGETYTENVSDFFERALQAELQKSGYQVSGVAERSVTGRIEAFGLDHSPKGNRIDAIVQVNFQVQRGAETEFEYLSTATKEFRTVIRGKAAKDMLIELTQVCIAQFLAEARAQNQL